MSEQIHPNQVCGPLLVSCVHRCCLVLDFESKLPVPVFERIWGAVLTISQIYENSDFRDILKNLVPSLIQN